MLTTCLSWGEIHQNISHFNICREYKKHQESFKNTPRPQCRPTTAQEPGVCNSPGHSDAKPGLGAPGQYPQAYLYLVHCFVPEWDGGEGEDAGDPRKHILHCEFHNSAEAAAVPCGPNRQACFILNPSTSGPLGL